MTSDQVRREFIRSSTRDQRRIQSSLNQAPKWTPNQIPNKNSLSPYNSRPSSVRRGAVTIRTAAKDPKVVRYSLIVKDSHLDDLAPLQKPSSSYFVSFIVRTSLATCDFYLYRHSCLLIEVLIFACPVLASIRIDKA